MEVTINTVTVENAQWDAYNIGDPFEIDGQTYIIVRKESLSKMTDGVYDFRPIKLTLC